MQILRLRVDDKIYKKFMWLLSKFEKNEIEIISEEQEFLSTQRYLQKELDEIESGKAKFYTQTELDNRLNEVISKYENNL